MNQVVIQSIFYLCCRYVGELVNTSVDLTELATEAVIELLPSRFHILDVSSRVGRRKKTTPMFARNVVPSSQAVPPSAQLPPIVEDLESSVPQKRRPGRPKKQDGQPTQATQTTEGQPKQAIQPNPKKRKL
jgi:hypothetical protein